MREVFQRTLLGFNFFRGQAQTEPQEPEPQAIVQSVILEPINSPLETVTGGKRIFPDKDINNPTQNRKIVRVKATISPILLDEKVVFKAFDVDDPTSDTIIDPNGIAGEDNRPVVTGGNPGTLSATDTNPGTSNEIAAGVDVNGVAIVYLTVTMQPGNNVVIAASAGPLDTVTVDGTGLKDGNTPLPTKRIKRTELLTTWRKLHIEVDSMGSVSGNFLDGTFAETKKILTTATTVQINQTLETNRFENGRLVSGTTILTVDSNTTGTLTVRSPSENVLVNSGDAFRLYDDDDFNDNDGTTLYGDTLPSPGENVSMPDTSLLTAGSDNAATNVFAPAYIWPVYDIGDNNTNVPFVENLSELSQPGIRGVFDFDQVATESDQNFWTVYLLSAYQITVERDGDPLSFLPNGLINTAYGISDADPRMNNGQGAIVFAEDGRGHEYPADWTTRLGVSRAGTAAHEIGHLFGCIHDDGGLMASTPQRNSITFTPVCLNEIRKSPNP